MFYEEFFAKKFIGKTIFLHRFAEKHKRESFFLIQVNILLIILNYVWKSFK